MTFDIRVMNDRKTSSSPPAPAQALFGDQILVRVLMLAPKYV